MPGEERALYSCQEGFRGVGRPEINCVQDIWEKVHSITPSIMFTIIISSIIVIFIIRISIMQHHHSPRWSLNDYFPQVEFEL